MPISTLPRLEQLMKKIAAHHGLRYHAASLQQSLAKEITP